MITQKQRINVADALRGFSVMGIMLLHCIEHFNFYSFPEVTNSWLQFTDKAIWDSLFFTFGGKAYAIFALLFGFSFFIQDNNQLRDGSDFRLRFLWRLFLLFIWGNINAIFFTAEVLVLFSITGVVLIFVARLKTKTILIIAAILMLQPMEWGKLAYALLNPDYEMPKSLLGFYWGKAFEVQSNGSFIDTVKVNLWYGQLASLKWAWENARFFQMPALFMLGMLIGREKLFVKSDKNIRFWRIALVVGLICFFPLNGLLGLMPDFIENKAILTPLRTIIKSLANVGFTAFLVSIVIQAYYLSDKGHKLLSKLEPYGKMSLTNYIMQSMVGSAIFYNWGLGMHNKLGITASFLLGIALFLLQLWFCHWWMKNHKQGPLEYIWKQLTWIDRLRDKHVYFISGMCNNCNVYNNIKLPKGYCKKYIEWKLPAEDESLEEYTKEMVKGIKTSKPFILVGYSFGGVIVQEMNELISPQKTIIISSIKNIEEIPSTFRLARKINFSENVPDRAFTATKLLTNLFTRFVYSMPADKLKDYMTVLDPTYIKWSVRNITNWTPKGKIENLYHIHGSEDQIFPISHIKDAYVVQGGDHLMVINKAKEVSRIMKGILD